MKEILENICNVIGVRRTYYLKSEVLIEKMGGNSNKLASLDGESPGGRSRLGTAGSHIETSKLRTNRSEAASRNQGVWEC